MRRAFLTNVVWALFTVGTFVAGSKIAGKGSGWGGKDLGGVSERTVMSSAGSVRLDGEVVAAVEGSELGEAGQLGEEALAPALTVSELVAQNRGGKKAPPLSKEELTTLVLESIRSADPVVRRAAFDRVLEEMASGHFTAEQAHTVRGAMHHNGATGDQWRLFDYAWGAHSPADAIANLEQIPERYLGGYLGNMLPGLASTQPGQAIELFRGLDEGLQGKVRNRLYEGLIDNDLGMATDFMYSSVDTTKPGNWRPMDQMAREVVKENGIESALVWAEGLPEGALRGNAWSAAYANWASRAPEAAVESIMEMEPSGDRNQAINGFVSALAGQDGEAAALWAGEISDKGMREAAQVRVGQQFFKQDEAAAAEWFVSSGLPSEAWARITK